MGIDKLVEFIINMLTNFTPVFIILQYQKGARLRFGKLKEVLEPGIYWKLPFVDHILAESCVETTLTLPVQSLYTIDNQSIVVKGMIAYRIFDFERYVLEVWDAADALSDKTCKIIKDVITCKTWEECRTDDIDNLISIKARANAKKYGIEVLSVGLTDIDKLKTIRLINETANNT